VENGCHLLQARADPPFEPVLLGVAPRVADAFVHGGGVGFDEYGEGLVDSLDLINRGNYEHRFASDWLQKLPDVIERLEAGADVLDVGCGAGRVSMALAEAFPNSHFSGIDLDSTSIRQANDTAAARGLADRVEFTAKPISELGADQRYDLITACDCIHDFSAPIQTLGEIRERLKSDGTLFVVEPKAADNLEDNINPIATMFYGFSVFHCMTQSLADGGPGLGTCMGPAQTKSLLNEAGFSRFQRLDIKSHVNLFYAAGH
jgi:2-polyprenyl-3-methyl-5-hydroxy-6-metoxy-1,4-benzoquinol methylase